MNYQDGFNIALSLAAFLGGWILNSVRDSVKSLHQSDEMLANKVQAIEILVAGQYVKRDDLEKSMIAIFTKLDRIEQKLDNKVDKPK
jgi:hypothetical protein